MKWCICERCGLGQYGTEGTDCKFCFFGRIWYSSGPPIVPWVYRPEI